MEGHWNSIDLTDESKPLEGTEVADGAYFCEELSDYVTEEWKRIVLRRIAATFRKEKEA